VDQLDEIRNTIERVLLAYTKIPYAYGEVVTEAVFDRERDRYVLMNVGWDQNNRRVHGALVHLDLVDGRIWIQRDGLEEGIAVELYRAGIPKDRFVFALRPAEVRDQIDWSCVG
jgi:hypothetical protein